MSVIMTLRMKADPRRVEELAAEDPSRFAGVAEIGKERGVIAHRFYGSDTGEVMVIDEWPDTESFQRFFEETRDRIQPLMADAGVQGEPEITFWRKLETHDEVGWGN
ncbi:MAG TPA: hypothetical protein VKR21_14470 [Solirubrobacteraceae bacterium]|nr:hypothetical protein [Solirubrobacteraceae bacterium]